MGIVFITPGVINPSVFGPVLAGGFASAISRSQRSTKSRAGQKNSLVLGGAWYPRLRVGVGKRLYGRRVEILLWVYGSVGRMFEYAIISAKVRLGSYMPTV